MKTESGNFEQSLQKLETLVRSLESGSLPLEDALSGFQEGVGLIKQCQELLNQAEQKIEILTKANSDGIETKPFSSES
jgi:exodeoxyribonuclease VII small subunit